MLRLIEEGVIPPFCALLECKDNQIINVVLDGINNMLKKAESRVEALASAIEECGGIFKLNFITVNFSFVFFFELYINYDSVHECDGVDNSYRMST